MDPTCCTPEQLELIGVTGPQVLLAFVWGFGCVTTSWFLGFVTNIAIAAIKKA